MNGTSSWVRRPNSSSEWYMKIVQQVRQLTGREDGGRSVRAEVHDGLGAVAARWIDGAQHQTKACQAN